MTQAIAEQKVAYDADSEFGERHRRRWHWEGLPDCESMGALQTQALYFPYISVPEDAWFARVLLYWDVVGTIVPTPPAPPRMSPTGVNLSRFTRELMDAGLVRAIRPEPVISDKFTEVFLTFVDSDPEIRQRRDLEWEGATRLYLSKMGWRLSSELQRRGLARPDGRRGPGGWWYVEARTAAAYVTYLARCVAVSSDPMDLITDRSSVFYLGSPVTERAEALRLPFLEKVLPAPVLPVGARELIEFKAEFGVRCLAFRAAIEEELLRIAVIDDGEARGRQRQLSEERLRSEVAALAEAMRARRWPKVVFGTLCGATGAGLAAGGALSGGLAGLALALPGAISGLYGAMQVLSPSAGTDSVLAYAAFAQNAFS